MVRYNEVDMLMRLKKYSGQMLIEIVVAVGIIGLVLIGVSDLMTRSARTVVFQKYRDRARSIAVEHLNKIRTERDADPQMFYTEAVSSVIDPCVTDEPYVCIVTMDKSIDGVLVTVRVEWIDGGQTFNLELSQYLARDIP